MQDKYVGDIGDFGKYGLLRFLTEGQNAMRLGVLWYLVPDEASNSDGLRTTYSWLRKCDAPLYDALGTLLADGARSIRAIEESGVLPHGTVFASEPLAYDRSSSIAARTELRKRWLSRAHEALGDAELIFLDPDTGFETKSVGRFSRRGPKYAFFDDLRLLAQRQQSVIGYQHRNRQPLMVQVRERQAQIAAEFAKAQSIVLQHDTRLYFVIPAKRHLEMLNHRIDSLARSPWANVLRVIE